MRIPGGELKRSSGSSGDPRCSQLEVGIAPSHEVKALSKEKCPTEGDCGHQREQSERCSIPGLRQLPTRTPFQGRWFWFLIVFDPDRLALCSGIFMGCYDATFAGEALESH